MTAAGSAGSPSLTRWALGLLATGCLGLTSCSSSSSPASSTTSTTAVSAPTVPGRPAVYRAEGVVVRAAFPGTPLRRVNPPTFVVILPPGSHSVAWSIGNLGTLTVHSYELVIAAFPPKTSLTIIDDFLAHYGGVPNTTLYGRPGIRRLVTIPIAGGKRYSGITAFSVGTVLVIAVGFDAVAGEVSAFIASVRLERP